MCERANGFWRVNFQALHKSQGSVSRRKRCKRCKVRLLYQAAFNPETGKVAVLCLMDDKAKVDVARLFQVDMDDVDEALAAAKEDQDELRAPEAEETPLRDTGL
jgi:hypothetical protein